MPNTILHNLKPSELWLERVCMLLCLQTAWAVWFFSASVDRKSQSSVYNLLWLYSTIWSHWIIEKEINLAEVICAASLVLLLIPLVICSNHIWIRFLLHQCISRCTLFLECCRSRIIIYNYSNDKMEELINIRSGVE